MRLNRMVLMVIATCVLAMAASAQTLADRARELRKDKRTQSSSQRVFTNESLNLRPAPAISDTSSAAKKPSDDAAATDEEGEGDAEKAKGLTPDEEKAKAAADFKDKIEKAKAELAQLQREADVAQRENRLKAAVFYADAGTKLRDERKYADEDRKAQAELADKQKKIADTQAAIDRLRDGARRAGIPAGMIP